MSEGTPSRGLRAWVDLESGRFVVLVVGCLHALILGQMVQCDYMLINDLAAFVTARGEGGCLGHLVRAFTEPTWLYRPMPEVLACCLSSVFGQWSGGWHALISTLRLVDVALVWVILGVLRVSPRARVLGTLFFALFPAIPEVHLVYAEAWLVPLMLVTLLGCLQLHQAEPGALRRVHVVTAVAFVLMTMCKEILVPLSAVFLAVLYVPMWRKGTRGSRIGYGVMGVFLLVQAHRCYLAVFEPYAQGFVSPDSVSAAGSLQNAAGNLLWEIGGTLLHGSNVLPTTLLLGLLCFAGVAQLLGRREKTSALVLGGTAVCLGIHALTPYEALRYLYPGAVFTAIILALGCERLLTSSRAWSVWGYRYLVIALVVFGGPALVVQALVVRTSSNADWAYLDYVAEKYAEGRDVVLLKSPDAERSSWLKQELDGLNLTGHIEGEQPHGRLVEIEPGEDIPVDMPDAVMSAGNPFTGITDSIPPSSILTPERVFDYRADSVLLPAIHAHLRVCQFLISSDYSYPADAGSMPFPGYYWVVFRPR